MAGAVPEEGGDWLMFKGNFRGKRHLGDGSELVTSQEALQKVCRLFAAITFCVMSLLTASVHAADAPLRILALGDSLTAGYGLEDIGDAFPAQLEKALKAKGHNVVVLQGGISGDTTSGGRSRLEWSLGEKPDAVIVELGGNDALRAVDPKITAENLDAIVKRIQQAGLPVLLAGMLAPPNLGRDYGDRFNAIYAKIAKDTGVLFYPFFLQDVITVADLMQGDHIHPNPKGVKVIVKGILPVAEKLVEQAKVRRAEGAR
jgi:acyl-CoA thioesterase-1